MKNITKNIKIIIIISVITIIFFPVGKACGESTSSTITISPPKLSVAIEPGQTANGTLSLFNQSDIDREFMIELQDFIVADNEGTPQLLPVNALNNRYAASQWIKIEPSIISVAAGERITFDYTIEVPVDARPGGHYSVIIYKPIQQIASEKSAAFVATQVATLVLIEVPGQIQQAARITKMSAPSLSEYGPVTIATEIQNNGDLHIAPIGQISVTDIFGRAIVQIPLPTHNIFPGGASREYKNIIGSKWMIGRFEAKLTGSYGKNNNLPLTASVGFWVIPWKIVIITIVTVITIITIILWLKASSQSTTNDVTSPSSSAPESTVSTKDRL